MKSLNREMVIGLFVAAGLLSLFYVIAGWSGLRLSNDYYQISARFTSASGLNVGADVEIAGVVVGQVNRVDFDEEAYQAVVQMNLPSRVVIQEDAIASIRTTGVMGPKFIKISPGGSERILVAGEEMTETESSISLEELVSKYIFDSVK